MKKTNILIATAALASCGLSTAFGQIQIMSGQPHVAPRLVATQTGLTQEPEVAPVVPESIPNPFDFFASEDPSSIPSTIAPQAIVPTPAPKIVAEPDESSADVDPKSLPVGRRHRQQSMTETILDHGTVSAIPHTGMAPVCWSAPDQTPNPIASILFRQDCNQQALWDGYPAQRAAECAHMWQHLSAQHRCGHGHHGGCATTQSGCATCAPPVRNRYTGLWHGHHTAPAANCDSQATATAIAPNASCSTTEPSDASSTASVQSIAAPATAATNVANLPLSLNR